ncbi:MAG: phosphotransferase, partial [Ardenticatenaceae bacterium]
MLEKPELQEDRIISCLRERYGLRVCGVAFLPLGNDSTAWVYRVRTDEPGGRSYFLKVKRGRVYEPALFVPRYLKDQGIEQVVAPLPTNVAGGDERALWARVDDTEFALILYPFVEGRTGMESGMSDEQWVELGQVLRRIHSTRPPPPAPPPILGEGPFLRSPPL